MGEVIGTGSNSLIARSDTDRDIRGELLLLGYSDFLRHTDETINQANSFDTMSRYHANAAFQEVATRLRSVDLSDPQGFNPNQIAETISQETKDKFMLGLVFQGLANQVRQREFSSAILNRVINVRGDIMEWTLGSTVEIEWAHPEKPSEIIAMNRYNEPGKTTNMVKGKLKEVKLEPFHAGRLVVRNNLGKNYAIYGFIDRQRNYASNIKLTML